MLATRKKRIFTSVLIALALVGILTSLVIVFIEGWVYQNLEVKQVNAYFWSLVGVLAFLSRTPEHFAPRQE